jgi:uncharacterized protein (TIGR02596 family)
MRRAPSNRGFTLVELLVVLAIMAILGALTVPSLISTLTGSALTQSGQKVINDLSFARQTALTRNRMVEIRFYQFAKAGMPGEVAGSPSTGQCRAMQTFIYDSAGTTASSVTPVRYLPDTVIMDSNNALSTLLGATQTKSTWTVTDPQIQLPNIGTAYNACYFDYRPDGSTNLNPIGTQWFVTLHSFSAGNNLTALPKNFVMLQVDALNGHVQTYRPQ